MSHVRGVEAFKAGVDRLYEAYAARTRRHVAVMQELAALRARMAALAVEWDEHAPHADQPAVYEIHAEQLRDVLAASSDTTADGDEQT